MNLGNLLTSAGFKQIKTGSSTGYTFPSDILMRDKLAPFNSSFIKTQGASAFHIVLGLIRMKGTLIL